MRRLAAKLAGAGVPNMVVGSFASSSGIRQVRAGELDTATASS
jgi:hypothetical protein